MRATRGLLHTDEAPEAPERLPARRQRQPHEGLVRPELSVEIHEVFLLPLHHPGELPMLQLYLEHRRHRLETQHRHCTLDIQCFTYFKTCQVTCSISF